MQQVSFREKKPTLFLVATPIGNLSDFTYRAIEVLNMVEVIFAEDTRTSGFLLKHYNITTKQESYHDHNKFDKISDVLKYLDDGYDVALISDAGTPGISDPGYELINEVINKEYYVVSIPGPVASITALVASGLPMQPHTFVGFLPRKNNEIKQELNKYLKYETTLIFYESPHRISKTIELLYEVLGKRKLVVAKELTKIYETITRTNTLDAQSIEFSNKGEYILLVEGYNTDNDVLPTIEELYKKYIEEGINEKEVLKLIATTLNISKKEVYQKIKIDNN